MTLKRWLKRKTGVIRKPFTIEGFGPISMYESLGTISDQIKQQVKEARESEICKNQRSARLHVATDSAVQDGNTVNFIVEEVIRPGVYKNFSINADWEDKTVSWSLSWLPPGM